jgi:hypothetical protein
MTTRILTGALRLDLISAALLFAASAPAQTLQEPAVFQYFTTGSLPAVAPLGKPVTGRPLAASESRRTLQVLADGTRIERKDTNKLYRDTDGRTRTESADGERVTISDPTSGSTVEMNTSQRSARKSAVMRTMQFRYSTNGDKLPPPILNDKFDAGGGVFSGSFSSSSTTEIGGVVRAGVKAGIDDHVVAFSSGSMPESDITIVRRADSAASEKSAKTENLGIQNINGVLADGTRTTITIPTGEIGNDRPINIVNEKWFSTALGMLVKSVNSDPRFGETTYELTDIREGAQDPLLFQVPEGYNFTRR